MSDHFRFAYERVESHVESLIANGVLAPGEKVPSVREICRVQKVSPSTAVRALGNLEAKSLVCAKPRSGFFVQRPSRLPLPSPSAAPAKPQSPRLSEDVARVFNEILAKNTISLGAGAPDHTLLPTGEISRCVSRAARQFASDFGRYAMSEADMTLRREIAVRLARSGCFVSPDEVIITNGCMDAINLALRAVASPGDTILVESPTYFGLLQIIESLGMKAVSVPSTCDEGMDLTVFGRIISRYKVKACVLIPSFSNPNGACLPDRKREALSAIASANGIPIIEDDIYGELAFGETRPRPIKAFGDPGNVMLCGSLSKTLSPALRVGWVVAGRHAENVRRLRWITSVTTPHVTARAAADYLRSGGYDKHLRGLCKVLRTRISRMSHSIAESFPQGTALSRPEGGYFLWVELPWRINSLALRDLAGQQRISVCPGPIFSVSGEFQNFIRLNCALRIDVKVERAIRTLGKIAGNLNSDSTGFAI